jgi:hypothetical protein
MSWTVVEGYPCAEIQLLVVEGLPVDRAVELEIIAPVE